MKARTIKRECPRCGREGAKQSIYTYEDKTERESVSIMCRFCGRVDAENFDKELLT